MSSVHIGHIPDFIEARSAKALRALMLKTNTKHGMQFRYFDIQVYDKNGRKTWIAWFYRDIQMEEEV